MSLLNTTLFSLKHHNSNETKNKLKAIANTLSKEGYEPLDQIVGYLLTGEPIYITAKNKARSEMRKLDRSKVLSDILKEYLK